jgi:hypothetical protein
MTSSTLKQPVCVVPLLTQAIGTASPQSPAWSKPFVISRRTDVAKQRYTSAKTVPADVKRGRAAYRAASPFAASTTKRHPGTVYLIHRADRPRSRPRGPLQ